jgi:hypothetical protein
MQADPEAPADRVVGVRLLLEALVRAAQMHARRAHDPESTQALLAPQAALAPLSELPAAHSPAVKELAELVGTLATAYLALCDHLCAAVRAFWERHREALVGLAGVVALDPVLVDYCCGAYHEEMRALGFGPLSDEEQREFLIATIALWTDEGETADHRPPLLAVALACDRVDIAAAIISRSGLAERAARRTGTPDPEVKGELPAQALVLLEEKTLRWLSRQAGKTGLADVNRRLRALTSDAYLYRAIHNELRRYLGRRAKAEARDRRARERAAKEREQSDAAGDPEQLATLRGILERFARRGGAKEMDRRLVEAFLEDPKRSARSLAQAWGKSERTVRYRRRLMLEYLRGKLGEDPA